MSYGWSWKRSWAAMRQGSRPAVRKQPTAKSARCLKPTKRTAGVFGMCSTDFRGLWSRQTSSLTLDYPLGRSSRFRFGRGKLRPGCRTDTASPDHEEGRVKHPGAMFFNRHTEQQEHRPCQDEDRSVGSPLLSSMHMIKPLSSNRMAEIRVGGRGRSCDPGALRTASLPRSYSSA